MGDYYLSYLDEDSLDKKSLYKESDEIKYIDNDEKYELCGLINENEFGLEFGLNRQGMFAYAKSFNQPLDSWNVSNVKAMRYMFENTKSFNQNLDSWSLDSLRNGVDASDFKGSAMENNPPKWCKK